MLTEPKIGAMVAWGNVRYRCHEAAGCKDCDMCGLDICGMVQCSHLFRRDGRDVIFIREGHYIRKGLSKGIKRRRRKA